MNLAFNYIGVEKEFSFSKNDNSDYANVNYFLLPMYSTVVNLKVLLYQFGIVNQKQLGISDDAVTALKQGLKVLIDDEEEGAAAYIYKVFRDQFELEYETCVPDTIFNSLAVVRQYCALNGFEFIELWRSILADPFTTKKPYNTTISYSTHFSRPTPLLARQMVPLEVTPPLQPKLIDGKRNKMSGVMIWIFRTLGNVPKIQGLGICYENGDIIGLGERSNEKVYIDFKGAYLKKLTVWGCNALDMFEFEFSDGNVASCGSKQDAAGVHREFYLEFHHIAGIMITNDATGLSGQSASIAVSYQLTPEEEK